MTLQSQNLHDQKIKKTQSSSFPWMPFWAWAHTLIRRHMHTLRNNCKIKLGENIYLFVFIFLKTCTNVPYRQEQSLIYSLLLAFIFALSCFWDSSTSGLLMHHVGPQLERVTDGFSFQAVCIAPCGTMVAVHNREISSSYLAWFLNIL